MMPLLATLTREADEITAGKLFVQIVESHFSGSKKHTHKAGVNLVLMRGRLAREEMKQQEGGSLSASEAGQMLGISKTAVLKRYREGKLLGWREARQDAVRFPVWQFKDINVHPGISEVLTILNEVSWMDDWGKILFFLNQRSSLDGKSPLELLRKGRDERVLWAASAEVA